jgi:uncharacterized C2H2 Zn-finger protein
MGRMALRREHNGAPFLACPRCSLSLGVPRLKQLEPVDTRCAICRFQVLKVTNSDTGKHHFVCPQCFSNPPIEHAAGPAGGRACAVRYSRSSVLIAMLWQSRATFGVSTVVIPRALSHRARRRNALSRAVNANRRCPWYCARYPLILARFGHAFACDCAPSTQPCAAARAVILRVVHAFAGRLPRRICKAAAMHYCLSHERGVPPLLARRPCRPQAGLQVLARSCPAWSSVGPRCMLRL